jgi:hypothetical protein
VAAESHSQFLVEKRPSKRTFSDDVGAWPADQFAAVEARYLPSVAEPPI